MSKETAVLRNSWFTGGKLIPACTPIAEMEIKPDWHMIVYVDDEMNIVREETEPRKRVEQK